MSVLEELGIVKIIQQIFREHGTLDTLEKWYDKPSSSVNQGTLAQPQVLKVDRFGGLFLIGGVSLGLALSILKEVSSLKQIPGPDPNYNDICFFGAGSNISELPKFFPAVDMAFENGQKISLSPENYLFRHSKMHGGYSRVDYDAPGNCLNRTFYACCRYLFTSTEQHLRISNGDGLVVADSTWTYKIPTIDTIPRQFNVKDDIDEITWQTYKGQPTEKWLDTGPTDSDCWIRVPYPFQWGAPTFDAGEAFAMMAASLVALIELSALAKCSSFPLQGYIVIDTGCIQLIGQCSRRVVQISAGFMIFFSIQEEEVAEITNLFNRGNKKKKVMIDG
ncbi:hypothetical protein POM88_034774 [Heracleum sosnowskyi]|uniref:Uncharacterized protein n=1 Tax=Heracleum sosnowskyi TaxID=360622 RepID=A0AAD8HM22_9APIA|nr:hypothetical protein POM88_034774 [Heracleum sosnowskyi]